MAFSFTRKVHRTQPCQLGLHLHTSLLLGLDENKAALKNQRIQRGKCQPATQPTSKTPHSLTVKG
eukprot:327253-Pelagomonas_calceolata.AAC.2